jgi:hypothetical protein
MVTTDTLRTPTECKYLAHSNIGKSPNPVASDLKSSVSLLLLLEGHSVEWNAEYIYVSQELSKKCGSRVGPEMLSASHAS